MEKNLVRHGKPRQQRIPQVHEFRWDESRSVPRYRIQERAFIQRTAQLDIRCQFMIYTLEPTWIHPTELMHLWDPLLPWFSMSDKFSPSAVGSPPRYDLSLVEGRSCYNHISLGVPPLNTDMQTPCQVEVTPRKSEGMSPSSWSTLCQASPRSRPHTRSTLHWVKSGSPPTNQKV